MAVVPGVAARGGEHRAGLPRMDDPIEIRYNRYVGSVAIRWARDENRYRIEHDDLTYGELARRFFVGPNALRGHSRRGVDRPLPEPRPDIRRWTEPMRAQLRSALTMLGAAERHPWSG
jgi:hypothetical protein